MFDNLTQRLGRAMKALRGEARLTENNIQDALREVRLALLEADVALPVVKQFITAVRDKAVGQEVLSSLSPGQALVGVVQRELAALMGGAAAPLNLATTPPAVILLAGLQGSGKTTTAAKLARRVRDDARKKVLLVSCDVYRPAAMDQLETLAKELGIDCFAATPDAQPVTIARAALDWARRHYHDVLIVDTAGRLSIDEAMMREIAELHGALNPIETLFIVDAMQGQDAVNTASAFGAALPLTGIVLTKLDGDARGGAALSLRTATGQRIRFAGTGERPQDLEVFHAERMASRILGMGDVLSLIERAEKSLDQDQAAEIEKHLRAGQVSFDDFLTQIRQLRSMGSLEGILDMVPGAKALKGQTAGVDTEKEVRKMEAVILSMTARERSHPELIDGSRRKRIARGSGLQPADVNRVLKAREAMQTLAKQFGGSRVGKAGFPPAIWKRR